MNILILHRIPYRKIDYHRGIDHAAHRVTYFGKRELLDTLPADLPHAQVERPGLAPAFEEARQWLQKEPQHFDRVISMSEYELMDAARLREWLGVPGASAEQVSLVRNKIEMKRAIAQAGLRVPRFLPLPDFLEQAPGDDWRGALVVKPHSGASSEDVKIFPSAAAVRDAIHRAASGIASLDTANSADDSGGSGEGPSQEVQALYELEEFVAGPILHFDGLVAQGRILVLTASRYINTCLDYANGKPLGSYHIPVSGPARAWVERVLEGVRLQEGSFHLEAIESDEGLVFLEIGNRVGGADVVATFELATGIHLPSEELRILVGDHQSLPTDTRKWKTDQWHGWFVAPGHHLGQGLHAGIAYAQDVRDSAEVLRWNELPVGAALPTQITYQSHEVPLAGIIAAGSPQETQRWMETLFDSLALLPPRLPAPSPSERHEQPPLEARQVAVQ